MLAYTLNESGKFNENNHSVPDIKWVQFLLEDIGVDHTWQIYADLELELFLWFQKQFYSCLQDGHVPARVG